MDILRWCALLMLLLVAPVGAQGVVTPVKSKVPPLRRPFPPPKGYAGQKRITLEFVQADLIYVIKVLAREMERNVYIGPGVEGTVDLSLRDVPVYAALDMVLKMQEKDIGYKLADRYTLIVAPPDKLDQIDNDIIRDCFRPHRSTDRVRQEVLLERAPAARVMDFLQGQYKDVEFVPHPTMNGFYAVGKRSDILSIKNDVPKLDRLSDEPHPRVQEFVRIKYADLSEVRSLLATLVPDVHINLDPGQNMLVLEGTSEAVEQSKELLDQIDKPLEVVVECKVVDLNAAAQNNLRIHWENPSDLHCQASESLALGDAPCLPEMSTFRPKVGRFDRSGLAFQAHWQFLIAQGEAKIGTTPRVATQMGVPAQIAIGDKFPPGESGDSTVDLGVKGELTPTLRADGYIVCKISLEVTSLMALTQPQLPLTRRRHFEAELPIKDGETVALGGLWDAQDTQAAQAIPLLGDLPILGFLFRKSAAHSEPVLMLTPQLMK